MRTHADDVAAISAGKDFLDEMIEERSKVHPEFAVLLDTAIQRRLLEHQHPDAGDGDQAAEQPSRRSAPDDRILG